jgi:hypothetical protein
MKLLMMMLTLLFGVGAVSASADTQGCRKRHEQERERKKLEKELKDLIDAHGRENPHWNRIHWRVPLRPIRIPWKDLGVPIPEAPKR